MIPSKKVWQYYQKIAPDQVQCFLCSKIIRTGGGTTNARNHLKFKHKECLEGDVEFDRSFQFTETVTEADVLVQEVFEVEPERITRTAPRLPIICESRSLATPRKRSRKRRYESDRVRLKTVSKCGRTSDHPRIILALASMICESDSPISMVEQKGFRHFVGTAAPSYDLPSKAAIADAITAQYDTITLEITDKLKDVEHLSLSLLINATLDRTFLLVSTHFINPISKKSETIFLGIRPLSRTTSTEQLTTEIESVIVKFNLTKSKIVSVGTDESADMTKAVKLLFGEEKHVRCLAKVLHSVVKDGLEDSTNPGLQQVVIDVDTVVTDTGRTDFFTASQAEKLNRELTKPNVDATNRFIVSLPFVVEALSHWAHSRVTFDPQLLTEIIQLLSLFDLATREISANSQLTGSLVLPMINCIESAVRATKLHHTAAKTFRQKLLASLRARTKTHMTQSLFSRATLCDPRFKKFYLTQLAAEQASNACCNEVKEHLRALRRSTRAVERRISTNSDNSLWWKHDKTMAEGGFNSHVEMDTSIVSEDELRLYLGQELSPRNADPVAFWAHSQSCTPSLSYVALKHLTVLGSTIPVDVFASSLKRLLSSKRFLLTDDQLIERMFLSHVSRH